jgi:hypothetical protein
VLLPQTLPLSGAYLEERGAYLLDNGRMLVLWLGRLLDRQWGMEVGAYYLLIIALCSKVGLISMLIISPQADHQGLTSDLVGRFNCWCFPYCPCV